MTLLASIPNCTDLYSIATHGLNTPVVSTKQNSSSAALDASGGVRLTSTLTVQNPNDFPISFDSVDYTFIFKNGQKVQGSTEGITIDEQSTEDLTLSAVIPLSAVSRGASVTYTVTGTVHADSPAGIAIDVDFTGNDTFVAP